MSLPTVLLIIFEYGHILSAMGWLGGGILTAFVLGPNVAKLPPPASLAFNAKVLPKVVRFVQMMAGSTLLFGVLLLYGLTGGDAAYFATTPGITLSAGISLALVAAVIAVGVTIPAFNKISAIANKLLEGGQQAPPPELKRYATRARLGSLVALALLLIVLVAMVAAGY
ncbi:MAG TPA: hypothetical protein VEC02_02105 [Nitrososphaerales archaeon]|nr:hypothetical protein [Nitrososphaerales archaeon]